MPVHDPRDLMIGRLAIVSKRLAALARARSRRSRSATAAPSRASSTIGQPRLSPLPEPELVYKRHSRSGRLLPLLVRVGGRERLVEAQRLIDAIRDRRTLVQPWTRWWLHQAFLFYATARAEDAEKILDEEQTTGAETRYKLADELIELAKDLEAMPGLARHGRSVRLRVSKLGMR
jgi:hypothetical protein